MRRAVLIAALLSGLTAVLPALAQDEPKRDALDWLAGEPMTLLDWGIARLRNDLDFAAADAAATGRSTLGRSGAFYRPQDRKIVVYASFVEPAVNRTDAVCVELFANVVNALMRGAPQGSDGASWYLESVFGHEVRTANRPQNLGDQMAERIVLQITVGPRPAAAFEDSRRVVCTGRLDSPPAGLALRIEG
jgi:hypothetical protein